MSRPSDLNWHHSNRFGIYIIYSYLKNLNCQKLNVISLWSLACIKSEVYISALILQEKKQCVDIMHMKTALKNNPISISYMCLENVYERNMQIWKKAVVESLKNEQNCIIALKDTFFESELWCLLLTCVFLFIVTDSNAFWLICP